MLTIYIYIYIYIYIHTHTVSFSFKIKLNCLSVRLVESVPWRQWSHRPPSYDQQSVTDKRICISTNTHVRDRLSELINFHSLWNHQKTKGFTRMGLAIQKSWQGASSQWYLSSIFQIWDMKPYKTNLFINSSVCIIDI